MAMAKIWRNRIEAGTQIMGHCPPKYYDMVVDLIKGDLADGTITKDRLRQLVVDGTITRAEYQLITDEPYEEN